LSKKTLYWLKIQLFYTHRETLKIQFLNPNVGSKSVFNGFSSVTSADPESLSRQNVCFC